MFDYVFFGNLCLPGRHLPKAREETTVSPVVEKRLRAALGTRFAGAWILVGAERLRSPVWSDRAQPWTCESPEPHLIVLRHLPADRAADCPSRSRCPGLPRSSPARSLPSQLVAGAARPRPETPGRSLLRQWNQCRTFGRGAETIT